MRVLISGAGIGGLSLAAGLVRAGHSVHVVERSPVLRSGGAGIALFSNATACLRWLGVAVDGLGRVSQGFSVATAQGKILGAAGDAVSDEPARCVAREELHRELTHAGERAELHLGQEVVALEKGLATLSGGALERPAWVGSAARGRLSLGLARWAG